MTIEFISALSPAIHELNNRWNRMQKNAVLTIESSDNTYRWIQVIYGVLNIGLEKNENECAVKDIISIHYPNYSVDGYKVGKFWTISATINCDEELMKCIYAVMARSNGHFSGAVRVFFEEI